MAEGGAAPSLDAEPLTKADVAEWGCKFDMIANAIQNMETNMGNIQQSLNKLAEDTKETKLEAKQALQKGVQNEERIKGLEDEVKLLRSQLTEAINRQKRTNLRIKGYPLRDPHLDLMQVLTRWWRRMDIVVEDRELERAYWAGPFKKDKDRRLVKTDTIVVAFARERVRDAVLKKLRARNQLEYNGHKVVVFPDLAPETIKDRRNLKPITQALTKANIRFSWAFPHTLVVFRDGKRMTASDLEEGAQMLDLLELSPDKREESEKEDEEEGKKDSKNDSDNEENEDGEIPSDQEEASASQPSASTRRVTRQRAKTDKSEPVKTAKKKTKG